MTGLFGDLRRDASEKSRSSYLFGESIAQRRSASPRDLLLGIKQDPGVSRGYFAFPPPSFDQSCPPVAPQTNEHGQARQHRDSLGSENTEKPVDAMDDDEEVQRRANERRRRLEKEREMAALGEVEWVRSGGVLRDSNGRRDKARTESIKEEIRLQERERLLKDRWETHERKWRALLATDDPVSFKDIPWPVLACPSSVDELTIAAISDFLLEPLEVRAAKETKRERIRNSLLRWHPDKLSSVLCRVVANDTEMVREGVSAVFMSLKRMKEHQS